MLNVEERYMIREYYKAGMSISEIARRTGRDRKTVRKALEGELRRKPKVRKRKEGKLAPYVGYLEKRMEAGVLNAHKLYGEIVALGYTGKETLVRSFVRPYRQPKTPVATVRFETEPGEQAQVDWGHFGSIEHGGKRAKLYAFVMTLGWSRAMYVEYTVSLDVTWWLRCHVHGFRYLGGVPQEILHDNLKTAVVGRSAGGAIHWNERYLDFAEYYGFQPRACQPYRAQTKGKVESGVKYVRGNFWVGLQYSDLHDLNSQALSWLNGVANVRIHGTTGEVPFERLPHEPLASLHSKADYDTSHIVYRQSSRDCLVSYAGNFYSVPAAYAGQSLQLRISEQEEVHIATPTGIEIACHRLVAGRGQRITVAAHYAALASTTRRGTSAGAGQMVEPALAPIAPFLDAPLVESRPLSSYEALLEVVHE